MAGRLLLSLLLVLSPCAFAKKVDLDYQVRLLSHTGQAEVQIRLAEGSAVRSLDFDLGQGDTYSDFKADGQWSRQEGRGIWRPAPGKSQLDYRVRLNQAGQSHITPHWAVFRGEQLVPPARLDQQDGTELVARLNVALPQGWKSIETAWPRIGKRKFRIDDVSRLFDRPTGWMLAGNLGSRRTRLGETEVTVAAPQGQGMRRMDTLTLLTFVWPHLQAIFPRTPGKLLVVGARDGLERRAQSAHQSIFLNSDQALVNDSGTSPLLHELVQVFAQVRGRERSDWLGRSLAEYYASELLRRAGGLSDDRDRALHARRQKQAEGVSTLRTAQASPAQVARGVLLLQALDMEIRIHTQDKRSLDDVTRALMRLPGVDTEAFVQLSESVLGKESEVLRTKLLRL